MPDKTPPFNELAKSFDPMMPQDTYDALRHKYFNDHVVPTIPKGFSEMATREEFLKQTERPKLIQHPTAAKLAVGTLAASTQLLQPVASVVPQARQLLSKTRQKQRDLQTAMARDSISSTAPEIFGDLAGSGLAFAGIEAATRGAGTEIGVDELLAGVAQAGKAYGAAMKASKGAIAFGTYEALVDNGEHRGYAFAKGAALGLAFDGTFTLAGKLLKRGKVSPEEVEKEVANALQSEPAKKISPEVDQTLATHIQGSQAQARAEGKPIITKADDSSRRVRILGREKNGSPFTIVVAPEAEGQAIEALKGKLKNGGGVDAVFYHSEETGAFNRFAKMADQMDVIPKTETRRVKVEEGKAKKVASQMNAEGIQAEAVDSSTVHIETPKPKAPSLGTISGALQTHELPDGTRLQKGEVWDYARQIKQLWDPNVPPNAKRTIADQLAGKGFEKYIPQEWHTTVEEAGVRRPVEEGDFTPEQTEVESVMAQEIEQKSRNIPSAGVLGQEFKEGATSPPGFQIETPSVSTTKGVSSKMMSDPNFIKARALYDTGMSSSNVARELKIPGGKARAYQNAWVRIQEQIDGDRHSFSNLDVPPSERKPIMLDERGRPVTVTQKRDRMAVKVPKDLLQGSEAFVEHAQPYTEVLKELGVNPGGLSENNLPTMVYAQASRRNVYHEDLHISMGDMFTKALAVSDAVRAGDYDTMEQIANGIRGIKTYADRPLDNRMEEAFVHAATAIRFGEQRNLEILAHLDTSIDHVVDMTDRMATRLLDNSTLELDTQSNRAFQSRMQDLLRRTGKQRYDRWIEGADEAGLGMYYDAGTDSFKAVESGKTTTISKEGSVADFIEQSQGASEYSPSETIGFEMRGLRHSMAPLGSIPKSSGRMPMPELTPHEDRFRGIASVSAWIRPTMDWAATIDRKFERAGNKIDFFNKFKNVDDAVRQGQVWLERNYREAASFLKGDVNRNKTMFEFLTADPKYWDQMLPRFNMDKEFLTDVRRANEWLTNFRDDTKIQVFNYLRNDLPRLRGFNFDVQQVYGRGITDSSQMSFFHKAIVEGGFNPQDAHAGRFINYLLRAGHEEKYTGPALKDLQKLIDSKDENGMSVLGTLRFPAQNYVNYVRGIPDASQQIMTKTVGDFQKILGNTFKEINKNLPKKYQLPEEFNYPGSIVNKMMSLSYVAGIGLRPIIPVRDMLQVMTNTLPVLGPKKMIAGMTKALSSRGFAEARAAGALLDKHTVGELYGDIFQEIPPHSGGALDKAMEVGNKLLSPSRWGHNFGRAIAYHGELDSAVKAIRDYRNGHIDVKQLFEDTSMWFFPKPLQTRLLGDIMAGHDIKEVAQKIALETVDSTLWAYRRGAQPAFLRTGLGRIFGQYGMWPLNYAEFLKKVGSKYAEYPKKAMQATGFWLATNYAASSALTALGGDVGKWFYFSPAGYGGSPHMDLALALMKAPEDSQEGRDARKKVLEYPLNFVPASIETEAILKAMESGQPMFDGNGMPTKELIRVLGMKPQQEHLQDLSAEDWMKYEAGFKERR